MKPWYQRDQNVIQSDICRCSRCIYIYIWIYYHRLCYYYQHYYINYHDHNHHYYYHYHHHHIFTSNLAIYLSIYLCIYITTQRSCNINFISISSHCIALECVTLCSGLHVESEFITREKMRLFVPCVLVVCLLCMYVDCRTEYLPICGLVSKLKVYYIRLFSLSDSSCPSWIYSV